ncbi:uncharacterized protein LOC108462175 [Gossypium arboreum]|uniref:uncharacterized protein LOC108462175 n=1 Tax=Gossypium arboreum TaxID=29729 RepID=UPI0008195CE6|nr:uncharacterized protein LOC108462175 [Gossypium arboreum]
MDLGNHNDGQGNRVNHVHNPILLVDDRDRAIRQYVVPLFNELNPGIRIPNIEAPQFELKLVMFQMLQTVGQFSALGRRVAEIHEVDALTSFSAQSNQGNGPNTHMQHRPSQSQGFSQQAPKAPQVESSNSLEDLLKAYMAKNDTLIQSQATTLKNLENQIDEPIEKKESQPTVEVPTPKNPNVEKVDEICLRIVPYPQRLQQHKQKQEVEALEQMSNYVKFMKDILSKKKRLSEYYTVTLTKECSAFLQNKLPPKLKELKSFTIPCNIRESYYGKALCNLGASINLMPKSISKLLRIGEVRPTTMKLQLTDRSLAYPEGKIEDVLVRVHKFMFPSNFIVLDFKENKEVLIVLGRPYLPTGRTLIDMQKGELTTIVQDD